MAAAMAPGSVPTGSTWAVDERGVGLKATWRLTHGFINVSLWRDDRCVETFHLTPQDAATLVSFVVRGLADVATTVPIAPVLAITPPPRRAAVAAKARRADHAVRSAVAASLRTIADHLASRDSTH